MNIEYVITGDTEIYKDCLIFVIGVSSERAEETLNRMLNNPTESDKKLIKGFTNIRIEKVDKKDCWWNEKYD